MSSSRIKQKKYPETVIILFRCHAFGGGSVFVSGIFDFDRKEGMNICYRIREVVNKPTNTLVGFAFSPPYTENTIEENIMRLTMENPDIPLISDMRYIHDTMLHRVSLDFDRIPKVGCEKFMLMTDYPYFVMM